MIGGLDGRFCRPALDYIITKMWRHVKGACYAGVQFTLYMVAHFCYSGIRPSYMMDSSP